MQSADHLLDLVGRRVDAGLGLDASQLAEARGKDDGERARLVIARRVVARFDRLGAVRVDERVRGTLRRAELAEFRDDRGPGPRLGAHY